MEFRLAHKHELDAVAALYDSARQEPYSAWNEEYPLRTDAEADLASGGLYVLLDGGAVIGALSVIPENECDDLPVWRVTKGARELARVAVAPGHHGRGYASLMAARACAILREQDCPAVHISVAKGNLPARESYPRVGFETVGEAFLFGGEYLLMERVL